MTSRWQASSLLVAVLAWACTTSDGEAPSDAAAPLEDAAIASISHDGGGADAASAGGPPRLLPQPALVVANGGSAEITVIDPATLEVIRSFPTDPKLHPHHLGVSPDGGRVLVSAVSEDFSMGHTGHALGGSVGHSMVLVLHLEAGMLEQVIDVPATTHNAAFLPDGETVVLAMAEHGMVHLYESAYFGLRGSAETGSFPLEVTVTADGRYVVVCNAGDDTLSIIDPVMQSERNRIDAPAGPVGAWRSADGSLWLSSESAHSVSLLADDLRGIAATIDVGGIPGQALETPDGAELWVAVEDRAVMALYDPDSQAPIAEIPAGTRPHGLAFAPDGTRAFVTDEEGARVLVVDVASHEVTDEIPVGDGPNGIAWIEH